MSLPPLRFPTDTNWIAQKQLRRTSMVLLSTICLLLFYGLLCAQPTLYFERLTEADGLSQSSVTCLHQDRYGFMWIGTRDGLNRYDGYEFEIFRHRSDDSTSISNSAISTLLEDRAGKIWIGTDGGGLNCFDPLTETIRRIPLWTATDTFSNLSITCLQEDREGKLWIGTSNQGLLVLDIDRDSVLAHRHNPDVPGTLGTDKVAALLEDQAGTIWVGTVGKGLARWDPAARTFTHFPAQAGEDYADVLYEDAKGILWVGTWGAGLRAFDRETQTFEVFLPDPADPGSLSSDNVFSIAEDRGGRLWVGTRSGLNLFDRNTKRFQTFQHIETVPYSLSHDVVFSLYIDRTGLLWAGTWGNGLNLLPENKVNVLHYFHHPTHSNSLSSDVVTALGEDSQGHIWIGTEGGGLNRLTPATGAIDHFMHDPARPTSMGSDEVHSIYEAKNGAIWIGTFGGGLNRYDPQTDFFYRVLPDSLNALNIITISEDQEGTLWLGSYTRGLLQFDPASGRVRHYVHDPTDPQSLPHNGILSLLASQDGQLWVGTQGGLSRFNPLTQRFTTYRHNSADTTSLAANGVYALFADHNGDLWVGTRGGGLQVLEAFESGEDERPVFVKVGTLNERIGDWVLAITADEQQNLWVNSMEGIFQVQLPSREIRDLDLQPGNQGAFLLSTHTGHIYAGSKGVAVFHPDSLREDHHPASVFITGLQRYNSREGGAIPIAEPGIYAKSSITLSHLDRILNFKFASTAPYPTQDNRFAYFLEGFNQEWIDLGNERKLTFAGLAPGNYSLRLKNAATNEEVETALEIAITPPWWQTEWAYALYALVILATIWALVQWRTAEQREKLKQEKRVNEQLRRVDALKDQFLANTSHELRTPLQGIIGLSEFWQEKAEAPQLQEDMAMITSSGKRLAHLVNDILDFSKLKNYDIQLQRAPVNLRVLADVVLRNNLPLIKGKDVALVNNIPADLPPVDGDEDRLQQIFYNLIGNAIKFTEQGSIELTALRKGEMMEVRVKDTGTGIPADKLEAIFQEFEQGDGSTARKFAGTGLGLSICKRLVEIHGGDMWVTSTVGAGATFFFTLPVAQAAATTLQPFIETAVSALIQPFSAHEPSPATSPTVTNGQHHTCILVVDDEPINQQVFKNHLADHDFRIEQAMNGEEALNMIAARTDFDLVLLDVMMPRMSGYEVCQKIREQYLPSELPIIMITAKNQLQDIVQGLSLGANDYLPKPFHKQELLARIKTQIDLHHIFDVAGRFVPNEFLRSLNRERITEVALGDYAEKEVTVLFTDIRDYTSLSETMLPEENFRFVNAFHSRMGPVIRQNNGFVNQYLGDAIMAIFPTEPKDALQAAIAMQQQLREYNQHRAVDGYSAIRMGVGLHTGPLIMGIIGDQHRMDAATIADTVNTASRIESLTKYYGTSILLSEDSVQRMENSEAFHFRYFGKVQVKGKKEPVGLYECYDGDTPDVLALKLRTQEDVELGLRQFYARQFAEAAATFTHILKINPADHSVRLFLNKAGKYQHQGVPDNWTGVEVMTFK